MCLLLPRQHGLQQKKGRLCCAELQTEQMHSEPRSGGLQQQAVLHEHELRVDLCTPLSLYGITHADLALQL